MVTVAHPTNAAPCKRDTSSLNNGTRFIAQKLRDHKETLNRTPISSLFVPSLAEVSGTGEFRKKNMKQKNRSTTSKFSASPLQRYFPYSTFQFIDNKIRRRGRKSRRCTSDVNFKVRFMEL